MTKYNRWLGRKTCNAGHPLDICGGRRSYKRWLKGEQRYVTATCVYCKKCDHKRRTGSGAGKGWKRARTACPVGHPYEGANLGVVDKREGGEVVERRYCVACTKARWLRNTRAYAARKAADTFVNTADTLAVSPRVTRGAA